MGFEEVAPQDGRRNRSVRRAGVGRLVEGGEEGIAATLTVALAKGARSDNGPTREDRTRRHPLDREGIHEGEKTEWRF